MNNHSFRKTGPFSCVVASAIVLGIFLSPVPGFSQAAPFAPLDRGLGDVHADRQWSLLDAQVRRLDRLVSLTNQQQAKASHIFAEAYRDSAEALSDPERIEESLDISHEANDRIRALLTPRQLKIYDRTPLFIGRGGTIRSAWGTASRIKELADLTNDQFRKALDIYLSEMDQVDALPPVRIRSTWLR
jgi:hypothetical protein